MEEAFGVQYDRMNLHDIATSSDLNEIIVDDTTCHTETYTGLQMSTDCQCTGIHICQSGH